MDRSILILAFQELNGVEKYKAKHFYQQQMFLSSSFNTYVNLPKKK